MHNAEEKKPTFNIYVSSHHLAENRYNVPTHKPSLYVNVVRLKGDESPFVVLGREVLIHGASKLLHNQEQPLVFTHGRTVAWIETDSDVSIRLDDTDPRRQKLELGDSAWIKLTPEMYEKLKERHTPREGC